MGIDSAHGGLSEGGGEREDSLLFDAELRPNRSLSPRGFRILMLCVGLFSLVVGVGFFLQGAWPVLGFLGLDVAAVYLAFRLSYRSARLKETVTLSEDELSINRVQPSGRTKRWTFQPYWVRIKVEVEETEDVGSHGHVMVTSHGRNVRLGRFLAPDERQAFAAALNRALGKLGQLGNLGRSRQP